jgi:hypothetical protein
MAHGIEKKAQNTKVVKGAESKSKPEPAKKVKSSVSKKLGTDFIDIDKLAENKGLPGWEKAAFFRAKGWAPGKKVTEKEFSRGFEKFRKRQLGSGKI